MSFGHTHTHNHTWAHARTRTHTSSNAGSNYVAGLMVGAHGDRCTQSFVFNSRLNDRGSRSKSRRMYRTHARPSPRSALRAAGTSAGWSSHALNVRTWPPLPPLEPLTGTLLRGPITDTDRLDVVAPPVETRPSLVSVTCTADAHARDLLLT